MASHSIPAFRRLLRRAAVLALAAVAGAVATASASPSAPARALTEEARAEVASLLPPSAPFGMGWERRAPDTELLRSRSAFRSLTQAAARGALTTEHPRIPSRPGWLIPPGISGVTSARALGPNLLRLDGGIAPDSLVLTSRPVAFDDPAGGFRKIDLGLERLSGGEISPLSSPVPITLPTSAGEAISVGDGRRRFAIAPLVSQASDVAVEGYAAFYPNVDPDTDFVVKPVVGGVETFSIVRSPASPESFELRISAGTHTELREADDGDGYVLGDESGAVASIEEPRAWDADDRSVPLHVEIEDDTLVLHAPHRDQGFRYPIVVDPVVVDTCWANVRANAGCQVDAWESDPNPTYSAGTAGWAYEGPTARFAPYAGGGYLGGGLYIRNLVQNYFTAGEAGDWFYRAPSGVRIWSALFANLSQDNLPDNTSCLFVGVLENTGAWGRNSPGTFCARQTYDASFTWCPGVNCADRSGGTPGNAAIFGAMAQRTGWSSYWMDHMGGVALALTEMSWGSLNPYVSSPDFPDEWQTDPNRTIMFHAGDAGLGLKSVSFSSPENPEWQAIDADTGGPATRTFSSCTGGTRLACPKDVWTRIKLGNLREGFSTIRVKATDAVGKTYTYEHPIAIEYAWASTQYGGANGSVDNADEIAQVVDAMAVASSSERGALWGGLSQANRDYYVNSLLPGALTSRRAFGLTTTEGSVRRIFASPVTHGTIAEFGTPMASTEEAFVWDDSPPGPVYDGLPDPDVLAATYDTDALVEDGPDEPDTTTDYGCDDGETPGCPDPGTITTLSPAPAEGEPSDDRYATEAVISSNEAFAAGASRSWFSRYGARRDADAHALNPRTGLFAPIGDADCTNFVSQVWHLGGGLNMTGRWKIWDRWWDPRRQSTYSWVLVRHFVNYMVNKRQIARLISASPGAQNLPSGTGIGDAVEYDWGEGEGWSHLAVVVGLGAGDDRISQHSKNRRQSTWRRGWLDQGDPLIRRRMRARVVHVRVR